MQPVNHPAGRLLMEYPKTSNCLDSQPDL